MCYEWIEQNSTLLNLEGLGSNFIGAICIAKIGYRIDLKKLTHGKSLVDGYEKALEADARKDYYKQLDRNRAYFLGGGVFLALGFGLQFIL
jgi:hypothetical protein